MPAAVRQGLSWLWVAFQVNQQALGLLLQFGQVVFYGAPKQVNVYIKIIVD